MSRSPSFSTNPDTDWQVMVVGLGCSVEGCSCGSVVSSDPFAYTVGLWSRHGVPELMLGARPDAGDDLGGRWYLSFEDCVSILNRFARDWLGGGIGPGATTTVVVDGGNGAMTCLLGDPLPSDDVGAFAASPDAMVVPVWWSLSLNRTARRAVTRSRPRQW